MSCYLHPKHFASRSDMLSLVPKNAVIGEIGVFDGEFSAQLLAIAQTRELVLVHLWADELVESGDVDGNNVRRVHGRELEAKARSRFAEEPRVRVIRGTTGNLLQFPESYFDALYVDADHRYHAVHRDLEAAFRVVKDGGWLMGHDYGVNPERTDARWSFGVKEAVDDFCWARRQRVHAFAMDGCTSFAVCVDKHSSSQRGLAVSLRKLRTYMLRRANNAARRVCRAVGLG